MAQDSKGRIIPVPITNSYSEGLDSQGYFAAAYGARAGAVGRSLQTALPGALAKEVLASVVDAVVIADKSDDMPSIELPIERTRDLVDRYLAANLKGKNGRVIAKTEDLVTPELLQKLRQSGIKKVPVYTPLNAEMKGGGLPAMAFGLNERGERPHIGANLGMLAGQSITEPVSQLTLDSFHSGSTGGTKARVSKFDRIKQLFGLPAELPNKAALARVDGTIGKIDKSPAGGWDVVVGNETHYVSSGTPLKVREGQRIVRGDVLSEGPIHPQELADIKGIEAAQEYLVDQIQGEMGVRRPWVEVVVGAMTSHSQVDDPGDADDMMPGDVVPNWRVREIKKNPIQRRALDAAAGKRLHRDAGPVKAGQILSKAEINLLDQMGVSEVDVEIQPVQAHPIMRGTNMLPIVKASASRDWLARMDFRRLGDALSEGALRGDWSDIHGTNPIPAIAYGSEFGLGEGGRY